MRGSIVLRHGRGDDWATGLIDYVDDGRDCVLVKRGFRREDCGQQDEICKEAPGDVVDVGPADAEFVWVEDVVERSPCGGRDGGRGGVWVGGWRALLFLFHLSGFAGGEVLGCCFVALLLGVFGGWSLHAEEFVLHSLDDFVVLHVPAPPILEVFRLLCAEVWWFWTVEDPDVAEVFF